MRIPNSQFLIPNEVRSQELEARSQKCGAETRTPEPLNPRTRSGVRAGEARSQKLEARSQKFGFGPQSLAPNPQPRSAS